MKRAALWLGSEIVCWSFETDDDREAYEAVRRPLHRDFVVGLAVTAPMFVGLHAIYGYEVLGLPIFCLLALAYQPAIRWYVRREYGIAGVEIELRDGHFDFYERYHHWMFPRRIARVGARWIRAAHWSGDGLEFVVRPAISSRVVVSYRHLFAGNGIAKFEQWCEAHGITIDGVPPLPGGYVRPIEERRGL